MSLQSSIRTAYALLAVLALVACDSGGGEAETCDPASPPEAGTYPAGPYGQAEGATLEDFSFVTPDGGSLALSEVRERPCARLLLVSTAAGWCTACVEEQPRLQALYDRHAADGLEVMVSIFEDQDTEPAVAADASNWAARYELTFDVLADPDFLFEPFYDAQLTPMTMLVDLRDMEILYIATGFDESAVEALIDSQL